MVVVREKLKKNTLVVRTLVRRYILKARYSHAKTIVLFDLIARNFKN